MSMLFRHARSTSGSLRYAVLDLRPLDRLNSIKVKLGVLVAASVTASSYIVWWGVTSGVRVWVTFPIAIASSMVITQFLARGMTSPMRQMTKAAGLMSAGDYDQRVRATSNDEVGQLALAFNAMARDLGSLDAARREIVANVSHELRTPVAALRAQLENMVDGVTAPDGEALASALKQTERLTDLVSYLLDLSRLEAGAAGLQLRETSVQPLLADVVAEAQQAASSAGRDLRWEARTTPQDLRAVIDAARMRQVILNLLSNASRHSPDGGAVRVLASYDPVPDEMVLDVVDEGSGIPVDQRERIFERFERGNHPVLTGGRSTGGTGLGLAIARWAVGLHGGTIAVVDTAARASTTLPGTPDADLTTGAHSRGATLRVRLPARGPNSTTSH